MIIPLLLRRSSRLFFCVWYSAVIVILFCLSVPAKAESAFPSSSSVPQPLNWLQREVRFFRTYPHLDKAYRLMAENRFPEAREELEKYLKITPRDAAVQTTYVEVLYKLGDYAEVVRHTGEILQSQPDSLTALLYKGLAHQHFDQLPDAIRSFRAAADLKDIGLDDRLFSLNMVADLGIAARRYEEALWALTEITTNAGDFKSYYRLGMVEEQLGHFPEAELAYQEALTLAPDGGERKNIFLAQGEFYKKMSRWEKAQTAFESALNLDPDQPEIEETLIQLAIVQGNVPQAIALTEAALNKNPADNLWLRLSVLYAQQAAAAVNRKAYPEAIRNFEKSLEARETPEVLVQMAFAQALDGRLHEAIATNERLLTSAAVSAKERAGILKFQADLHGRQGEYTMAVEDFRNALKEAEGDEEALRGLGVSLYKLGFWQEASNAFRLANERHPDPELMIYLSRCYAKMDRLEAAIYYLRAAHGKSYRLQKPEKLRIYLELGHLYSRKKDFDLAAKAWANYLEVEYDPRVALSLGRVQRTVGDTGEARQTFEDIISRTPGEAEAYQELAYLYAQEKNYSLAAQVLRQRLDLQYAPDLALALGKTYRLGGDNNQARRVLEDVVRRDLPPDAAAWPLSELAEISFEEHRYGEALALQAQAVALQSSAEYLYRLGVFNQEIGLWDDAIASYEAALAGDPQNILYARHLGYAYLRTGRDDQAIRIFEEVALQDPAAVDICKELGYLFMKRADNAKAVAWFNRAIGGNGASGGEDVERLRQEINKLQNRLEFAFYQVYRSASRDKLNAPAGFGGGGSVLSQGGIDLTWQPPAIGFRNERIFQITSRILWNIKPGSLAVEEDSYQGSLGGRYKPFQRHNFFAGVERLMKIGQAAQDNWLLRGAYSWGGGGGRRDARWGNYQMLYLDTGYFLDDSSWAYSAEARQGVSRRFKNGVVLTPHIVIGGRWEAPDPFDASYAEGGVGILFSRALKWPGGHRRLAEVEILTQYRFPFDGSSSGVVISGIIRH